MALVHDTIQVEADSRHVWDLAGDPARIAEWVPGLASSMAEGDERRCTLADGAVLVERLIERSEAGRYYECEIVDAALPLRSYRSRLTVQAHGGRAHVDWITDFEAQRAGQEVQAGEMFVATYRGGSEQLRVQLEAGKAARSEGVAA